MYLFVNILLMPVLAVRYLIYTNRIKAEKKPFSQLKFQKPGLCSFHLFTAKNVSQYLSKIHLQLTEFIIKFLVAYNLCILN